MAETNEKTKTTRTREIIENWRPRILFLVIGLVLGPFIANWLGWQVTAGTMESAVDTGFVHAMFGGAAFRGDSNSDTGFAMAFGGGLDVKGGKRFAFRAIQFDYVPTRLFNTWQHNIRLGFGVVFKLGGG